MRPRSSAEDILGAFARFEEQVQLVDVHAARGERDVAAMHAEVAAAQAYWDHAGIFVSHRLEAAASRLAEGCLARGPIQGDVDATDRGGVEGPRRVLHVLTQATGIGGHTRMVWRWIGLDRSRSHSIALTRQGPIGVPPELLEASRAGGGSVQVLNRQPGGITAWAGRLRALARRFDLVVLHVFAGDLVALLAFSDRRGMPPTAFIDQSDHAFWLGTSYVDLLVGLRRSGLALAGARRDIPIDRTALLPIVLPEIRRGRSREEARAMLGIGPCDVVAITVARGAKFRPVADRHFLETVVPVLRSRRNVILLAVGPDPDDWWRQAAAETDGRVRALGTQADPSIYREAADLYLDSYPTVSTTSLLEAATYGLPVLTRCPHPGPCDVLCADAPGLERSLLRATDDRDHVALLERLVTDPQFRSAAGAAARAEVTAAHCGDGWLGSLENVYRRAMNVPPAELTSIEPADLPQSTQLDLLCSSLYGDAEVLESIRRGMMRGLPPRRRLHAWLNFTKATRRLQPGLLLPEWLHAQIRLRARR